MTFSCKFCDCKKIVKNGIIYNKQRYKCTKCKKTFRIGEDLRNKYDPKIKHLIISMYLENSGIRAISRVINRVYNVKISHVLIIQYIKKIGYKIEDKELKNKEKIDIDLIEMDELYTFVKKNPKKSLNLLKKSPMEVKKNITDTANLMCEFGLLLTATATKLLILR